MQAERETELDRPGISVLICTRNRPDDLIQTLPTVLRQDYPRYEIIIIDQSTDDAGEQWVQTHCGDVPLLRYIRTPTVGLSIARNLALTTATYELCAFTDDDCDVPSDWLARIAATFQKHPETDVLFSPVHAPVEKQSDPALRFPSLYFEEARLLQKGEIFGMGANMALRKSFWQKVGPFDALLGPGAPLPGSDEHDWLYRAHLAEAAIRLDPQNPLHRAWRTAEEWLRLTGMYARGDGAFAMKHLRCGDWGVTPLIARNLLYLSARGVLRWVQRGFWQYEDRYVRGYWRGLWEGLRFPIDAPARLYRRPSAAS
jgi:glycosyltransferase involved in cell wall biosynthesis